MKKCISILTLLIFSFSFVACNKSYATRELPVDTAQIARESNDIVVARCVSSEARKDESTGFIFTYTTFEVEESLQGVYETGNFVIRVIGGEVGDLKVDVPDSPRFVDGEDVVLFLGPENSRGYPVLKSFSKGVYRVKHDDKGQRVVVTPVSGMDLYKSSTKEKIGEGEPMNLEDFLHSLNQVIK